MALNRGRHLCSAGRPSRWALAHILVLNDIDSGVVNKLPKFADDTKLVGIVSSEYAVEQLRSDLQRLYDLSLDWQMLFNTESVNCYILVTEMLKVLIHYVGKLSKQRMKNRI